MENLIFCAVKVNGKNVPSSNNLAFFFKNIARASSKTEASLSDDLFRKQIFPFHTPYKYQKTKGFEILIR